MENELRTNLIELKNRYCEATSAAPASVAQAACGDWRFFERVEKGSSFTARVYDRAIRWFSDRWPDAVEWPTGVPRPERAAA